MLLKYLKHKISIKKLTLIQNRFIFVLFKLAKYFKVKNMSFAKISKIISIFKILFINYNIDVFNHKKFFYIFLKL